MSHMDSTVVIGSGARGGGGGGGPRELVARSRAEQNKAARAGNLTAMKKFGSLNATNQNDQKAWKVENADRFKMDDKSKSKILLEKRLTSLQNALGLTQSKLAQEASTQVGRLWVKPETGLKHDYDAVGRIESKYCWKVNGKWGPKRKLRENETQFLEYHEKLKAVKPEEDSVQKAAVKPAGVPVLKMVKPAGSGSK